MRSSSSSFLLEVTELCPGKFIKLALCSTVCPCASLTRVSIIILLFICTAVDMTAVAVFKRQLYGQFHV